MRFLQCSDPTAAVPIISNRINTALHTNQPVLWLVSGGSNIKLEAQIMAQLADTRLANLTIMLMDERYGDYGHADSNFTQLLAAGFDAREARLVSTLSEDNPAMDEIAHQFATALDAELDKAETVIGLFGMGGDGHTAGIKPGSPSISATGLVSAYDWDDYRRITMTFEALQRIDIAYLCAFGADKRAALEQLETSVAREDQPAQILKTISDCIVLNDQIGETSV